MKLLKMWIDTDYADINYEETIEVPDDFTEEECEEECKIFLSNHVEYGWTLESEIQIDKKEKLDELTALSQELDLYKE